MITFFELVARQGDPFFSPWTTRARFALLAKGVPFETRELTFKDLRFGGWKEKLGVEVATVPFLELDDGTFIHGSVGIALWLDRTYPDSPSVFLPAASLPVDTSSSAYKAAVVGWSVFNPTIGYEALVPFWELYVRRIAQTFDRDGVNNDYDYYRQKRPSVDEASWQKLFAADNPEDIVKAKAVFSSLGEQLSASSGVYFFSSPSTPGWIDFTIMGFHRMLKGTDAVMTREIFGHGELGVWVERMYERYSDGLKVVLARDPAYST